MCANNSIHPGSVLGPRAAGPRLPRRRDGLRIGDRNVFPRARTSPAARNPAVYRDRRRQHLIRRRTSGHNCNLGNGVMLATGATLACTLCGRTRPSSPQLRPCTAWPDRRLVIMPGPRLALRRKKKKKNLAALRDHRRHAHRARPQPRGLAPRGFDRERRARAHDRVPHPLPLRARPLAAIERVETEVRSPDVDNLLAFIAARPASPSGPLRAGAYDAADTIDARLAPPLPLPYGSIAARPVLACLRLAASSWGPRCSRRRLYLVYAGHPHHLDVPLRAGDSSHAAPGCGRALRVRLGQSRAAVRCDSHTNGSPSSWHQRWGFQFRSRTAASGPTCYLRGPRVWSRVATIGGARPRARS